MSYTRMPILHYEARGCYYVLVGPLALLNHSCVSTNYSLNPVVSIIIIKWRNLMESLLFMFESLARTIIV